MTGILIIVVLLALLLIWGVLAFNGLVRARNRVDEAWSGVDVQLKRRCDLVPNLVAAVRGYAQHERELLEAVAEARSAALGAANRGQRERTESGLSQSLTQLRAVAESYPGLKASDNFLRLQTELAAVENEVQAARNIFNGNVRFLNTRIETFPTSLVASIGSFARRGFFELELGADRGAPLVAGAA